MAPTSMPGFVPKFLQHMDKRAQKPLQSKVVLLSAAYRRERMVLQFINVVGIFFIQASSASLGWTLLPVTRGAEWMFCYEYFTAETLLAMPDCLSAQSLCSSLSTPVLECKPTFHTRQCLISHLKSSQIFWAPRKRALNQVQRHLIVDMKCHAWYSMCV